MTRPDWYRGNIEIGAFGSGEGAGIDEYKSAGARVPAIGRMVRSRHAEGLTLSSVSMPRGFAPACMPQIGMFAADAPGLTENGLGGGDVGESRVAYRPRAQPEISNLAEARQGWRGEWRSIRERACRGSAAG